MKLYKVEVRRALYRIGIRDARLGRSPTKDNPSYLRGFSDQYAREQIKSSMPF
jgi:hypothetical protein